MSITTCVVLVCQSVTDGVFIIVVCSASSSFFFLLFYLLGCHLLFSNDGNQTCICVAKQILRIILEELLDVWLVPGSLLIYLLVEQLFQSDYYFLAMEILFDQRVIDKTRE
jgi:hypothetical protein